jgi:cytochrome c oxidase subunit 3
MPGTSTIPDIELIIEHSRGGGGGAGRPPDGGDDGDDNRRRRSRKASPKRYYTGITVGIVSISMFFMALASAFLVRKSGSPDWVPVRLPGVLWFNTVVLLASSFTLEQARRELAQTFFARFGKLWLATTVLGTLFLAGQLVAWRQLAAQGVYMASNPASSFFYIFTGAHGVHLLGGVAVLLFVLLRNFEKSRISVSVAAEITSYYWHFMDGLWVFLLALLYLGK